MLTLSARWGVRSGGVGVRRRLASGCGRTTGQCLPPPLVQTYAPRQGPDGPRASVHGPGASVSRRLVRTYVPCSHQCLHEPCESYERTLHAIVSVQQDLVDQDPSQIWTQVHLIQVHLIHPNISLDLG